MIDLLYDLLFYYGVACGIATAVLCLWGWRNAQQLKTREAWTVRPNVDLRRIK